MAEVTKLNSREFRNGNGLRGVKGDAEHDDYTAEHVTAAIKVVDV